MLLPLLESLVADSSLPPGPRIFQKKYVNVQDPMLPTNNLGRSVSKTSFSRMKRALEHATGALHNLQHLVSIGAEIRIRR